jgi:hypothetical protein
MDLYLFPTYSEHDQWLIICNKPNLFGIFFQFPTLEIGIQWAFFFMGNYHEFLYSDEGFTTHREI